MVGEDLGKRNKFIKEFILADTNRVMVLYPEAVHYEKNGDWTGIDNTLIERVDDNGDAILENTVNSFTVKMPRSFKPGKPITIERTDIGFSLQTNGNRF